MKIFIDIANLEEIERAYSIGIIDGITTNPSLIKEALKSKKKGKKMNMEEYISSILTIAKNTPVSLEVTETDYESMVREGTALHNKFNHIANNVYIKIPVNTSLGRSKNFEGIKAIKALSQARIPVNATLIFTPEQALMAAKAGAKIVSPFVGRLDDYIRTENGIEFEKGDYFPAEGINKGDNGIMSGVDLIQKISQIFKTYNIKSEILAASIRNIRQLREVALAGAHIATIPLEVLESALVHKKTIEGVKKFTDDVVSEYSKLAKK